MRRFNVNRLVFLCFLISLISITSVYAFEFHVRPINNTIFSDETAYIEIDVTNLGSSRKDFTLGTSDFQWQIISTPLSDYFSGFSVQPDETRTIKLQLSPRGDLNYRIYSVRLDLVERNSNQRKFIDVPVEIRSIYTSTIEYAPAVIIEGSVNRNDRIDPRESSVLVVTLDNRNRLNFSSLDIIIESEFLSETFTTNLDPLARKPIEFNFDVDTLQSPGIYDFVIRVVHNERNIGGTPRSFPVQVVTYSDIEREVSDVSSFLSTSKTVVLTNNGNVENTDVVRVQTNIFNMIFTEVHPSSSAVVDESGRFYVWDVELNPGSSIEISVKVNYRPLLYVFIIIISSIILYFLLRSPVVVKKTSVSVDLDEGGISEMKVLIHVRNRTSKTFNSFSVTEYVPKIAKYLKSESLGSIQPTKVLNHEKKGTLLKWTFEAIEPFEERIIIYKTKLNFTVIGRLKLPQTSVKFKDDASGSYSTKSNRLNIGNLKKSKLNNKKRGKSNG